jgi:hypothetical protein
MLEDEYSILMTEEFMNKAISATHPAISPSRDLPSPLT